MNTTHYTEQQHRQAHPRSCARLEATAGVCQRETPRANTTGMHPRLPTALLWRSMGDARREGCELRKRRAIDTKGSAWSDGVAQDQALVWPTLRWLLTPTMPVLRASRVTDLYRHVIQYWRKNGGIHKSKSLHCNYLHECFFNNTQSNLRQIAIIVYHHSHCAADHRGSNEVNNCRTSGMSRVAVPLDVR